MSARDQLLAKATALEGQAATIWARINAASEALPACPLYGRVLVPAGMDADVQRAGDLIRQARALRQDAADLAAAFKLPAGAACNVPPATSPSAVASTLQGAGTPSPVDPDAELDAIAKRIAAA